MMGRQCDIPVPGTYCAGLQFFTYEAELARVEEKVWIFIHIFVYFEFPFFLLESDCIYL